MSTGGSSPKEVGPQRDFQDDPSRPASASPWNTPPVLRTGDRPRVGTDVIGKTAKGTPSNREARAASAVAFPSATPLVPGALLGTNYRLVKLLGTGAMGEVWEAVQLTSGKSVAVKVLRRGGETTVHRFMREARTVGMLAHPHVVEVGDFGHTDNGAPFFAMELVRGRTLADEMAKSGALRWDRALAILGQIGDALAYAHGKGVIHRDLKPSNVLITSQAGHDHCKLIDFGIAKMSVVDRDTRALTKTGVVQGTPAYMSPEQARGDKVDARADQYALGCIAYEMISGRRPFHGKSARDLLYGHLFTHPDPPRTLGADVPPAVEALTLRLLRKDPARRFATMAEVLKAIRNAADGGPPVDVPEESLVPPVLEERTAFRRPASENPPPDSRAARPSIPPSRVRWRIWIALSWAVLATIVVAWVVLRP